MANQEREYVIVNPNDPVVADLWKDVIQVDSNGNPQLDEQGRIIVKRYVVRGSSGVLKSEMDSAISNLNLKAVHNTDDETISGVKTFTSSPIAPTPNETVNNTQVATTAFVKNITNNLAETLNTVANKSNAISVTNTPSQSLESGSGEIVPNTAKLTNTVDLQEIASKHIQDLENVYANKDLSNLSSNGQAIIDNIATDLANVQVDIDNVRTDLANKAHKDFSNVTNPVQAFKDMSLSWERPDLSAGIACTAGFNCPSDGWIYFTMASSYGCAITINGQFAFQMDPQAAHTMLIGTSTFPVAQGDIFNVQASAGGYSYSAQFFPCKGAH